VVCPPVDYFYGFSLPVVSPPVDYRGYRSRSKKSRKQKTTNDEDIRQTNISPRINVENQSLVKKRETRRASNTQSEVVKPEITTPSGFCCSEELVDLTFGSFFLSSVLLFLWFFFACGFSSC
jgi:hypothetical protein